MSAAIEMDLRELQRAIAFCKPALKRTGSAEARYDPALRHYWIAPRGGMLCLWACDGHRAHIVELGACKPDAEPVSMSREEAKSIMELKKKPARNALFDGKAFRIGTRSFEVGSGGLEWPSMGRVLAAPAQPSGMFDHYNLSDMLAVSENRILRIEGLNGTISGRSNKGHAITSINDMGESLINFSIAMNSQYLSDAVAVSRVDGPITLTANMSGGVHVVSMEDGRFEAHIMGART